ncbi:MAG: hypothetical protein JWP63_4694 [Candidatus Solibacter sp.]|nr:hypothetical protein [Candidatus Solibacter sp.]
MSADPFIDDPAGWLGRHQAFAAVSSQCTAAQAGCLRQMRVARVYEQFGLTWDAFCAQHVGISRSYADRIIRELEELGESYFKLADVARISPETYREIAGHIQDDVIEIDGLSLPIVPENAPRIREAIRQLHSRVHRAEAQTHRTVRELRMRLDAILKEVTQATERTLPIEDFAALRGMTEYAAGRWNKLAKFFEEPPTPEGPHASDQ